MISVLKRFLIFQQIQLFSISIDLLIKLIIHNSVVDSDFDKLIFFNKSLLILEPWAVVFWIRKCFAIDQLVMQYWAM